MKEELELCLSKEKQLKVEAEQSILPSCDILVRRHIVGTYTVLSWYIFSFLIFV